MLTDMQFRRREAASTKDERLRRTGPQISPTADSDTRRRCKDKPRVSTTDRLAVRSATPAEHALYIGRSHCERHQSKSAVNGSKRTSMIRPNDALRPVRWSDYVKRESATHSAGGSGTDRLIRPRRARPRAGRSIVLGSRDAVYARLDVTKRAAARHPAVRTETRRHRMKCHVGERQEVVRPSVAHESLRSGDVRRAGGSIKTTVKRSAGPVLVRDNRTGCVLSSWRLSV